MSSIFTFDAKEHIYRDADNRVIPSVTQVLQNVGFYDELQAIKPEVLERKRIIGQNVHKATDLIEKNKLDWGTVGEEISGYLDAYSQFLWDTGFKTRVSEKQMLASISGMACGMTVDREGLIKYKGQIRPAIGEIKCTAVDEEFWGIQIAAYDLGLGFPPEGRIQRVRFAVQLKPNGKYKLFVYEDRAHYSLFTSALSLTWWKINNLKRYRNGFEK